MRQRVCVLLRNRSASRGRWLLHGDVAAHFQDCRCLYRRKDVTAEGGIPTHNSHASAKYKEEGESPVVSRSHRNPPSCPLQRAALHMNDNSAYSTYMCEGCTRQHPSGRCALHPPPESCEKIHHLHHLQNMKEAHARSKEI